ncbi:hypothetical protein WME92_19590 [Sorangium sp. So ce307]
MLVRRDPLAEVAHLVHAAHRLQEQRVHGEVLAARELLLVEAREEVEHPLTREEHPVGDLLRLGAEELVQPLARHEAELHRHLPEARVRRGGGERRVDLLAGERAVAVEHLADAVALDAGARGDRVAGLEEQRPARSAVDHDELAAPPCLPDEGHDVAQRTWPRDLPGEPERRAGPRVARRLIARRLVAHVTHHDEVVRRRQELEHPLPRAQALARVQVDGVNRAGRVDAHERMVLFRHRRDF